MKDRYIYLRQQNDISVFNLGTKIMRYRIVEKQIGFKIQENARKISYILNSKSKILKQSF